MLLHLIVFAYYIYIASSLPQTLSDRQMYYTTSIIPLIPVTLYGLNLANYAWNNYPIDASYLNQFFIEWCFTNPLFISNLSRIIPMKIPEQLFITIFALLTNVCGYLSHISRVESIKILLYCIASVSFFTMCGYLVIRYNCQQRKQIHPHSKRHYNTDRIYKTAIRTILSTWSIYPIIFIVYTTGYLTHEECAIGFVCMDFISTTIFTSLLIGYQENHYRRNSILSYFTRKAARVLPVESDDIASNYYDTEQSINTISISRPTTANTTQPDTEHI
jgi:bacteriorhodopsin